MSEDEGEEEEEEEEEEGEEGYMLRPGLLANARQVLGSFKQLTPSERELLARCVKVPSATVDWAQGDDVRGLEVRVGQGLGGHGWGCAQGFGGQDLGCFGGLFAWFGRAP
jgi:hypothetical protein